MRRLGLVVAGIAFACVLGFSSRANAYPQFQFSSGTQRCAQCHYSPAGYGLLTSWGRDESADTISRGGDGAFLHGAVTLPSWLALGGDVRLAALRNDVSSAASPETAYFPMQSELYARGAFGDSGISLYAAGGLRGTTRQVGPGISGRIDSLLFMSREHYLMWKPSATGAYARVGRFYAPFGLRLVEHVTYVRRAMGFNLYEETYNASGGYLAEDWEIHATAFAPPPSSFPAALQSVASGHGAAVYAEKRFASMAALAGQARVSLNNEQTITQGGVVGKAWLEGARMLAMGELDLQHHAVIGGVGFNQLVAYAGATFFPIKGLMAGFALERFHEDMRVAAAARNAIDVEVNFFPWAHIEVLVLGRYQLTGSGSADGNPSSLAMLQLHYYL